MSMSLQLEYTCARVREALENPENTGYDPREEIPNPDYDPTQPNPVDNYLKYLEFCYLHFYYF